LPGTVACYITGVQDTVHGSVMFVLDYVKRAGIQNAAIVTKCNELAKLVEKLQSGGGNSTDK
jgi:hypothetical protein